jgi:hypothetical protein
MLSLASGRYALRFGIAVALLASAQMVLAVESVKTVDEAVAASKKTGKPILTILGSET